MINGTTSGDHLAIAAFSIRRERERERDRKRKSARGCYEKPRDRPSLEPLTADGRRSDASGKRSAARALLTSSCDANCEQSAATLTGAPRERSEELKPSREQKSVPVTDTEELQSLATSWEWSSDTLEVPLLLAGDANGRLTQRLAGCVCVPTESNCLV